MESTVEKLKDFVKDNQTNILIAGAVAGTAALGYYGVKKALHQKEKSNDLRDVYDEHFTTQNLPLFAAEAALRERVLSNVAYDLVVSLSSGERFSGRVRVSFMVSEAATQEDRSKLFIDFHGELVSELRINDTLVPWSSINFNNHRIFLGSDLILPNQINHVVIKFTNTFVNNSAGLHRYIDPKDNEAYVFSHLEPFFCHRWFPCFDQPSLRAPFRLSVISPDTHWQVISNGKKT